MMKLDIFIGLPKHDRWDYLLGFRNAPFRYDKAKSIMELIAKDKSVSMIDLVSSKRKGEMVIVRQMSCYFIKKHCKLTFARIGKLLGNRDHSTIIHSIDRINDLLDVDKVFKQDIDRLELLINKL